MIRRTLVTAAVGLAIPVLAQAPSRFADTVDVQLVVVDVLVTGGDGRPVLDLTAEDFMVTEDGRPVTVSHFTPPSGPMTPERADGAAAGEERGERLVVFIDALHLGPASRQRALAQVQEVLERRLDPEDEVMVARFGGTVHVLLPMSRDRRALRRVLLEEGRYGAQAIVVGLGDERALQLIESRHAEATTEGGRFGGDPCVDLGFIARTHAEQVHARVRQTVSSLEEFVDSLAGFPGRKTLLHVSDGVPLVAGEAAYRFAMELCDGSGAAKGMPNAIDTAQLGRGRYTRWDPRAATTEIEEFNTTPLWERLAAHANTYQVSIYSLQASGPAVQRSGSVDGARVSFETEMTGRRNEQDPLFLLADETGGRAILDRSELKTPLGQMVDDASHRYQLAYEPPSPGDGKVHRIGVDVGRPGVEVRYRRSYTAKDAAQRMVDGVLSTLFHGREDNPLAARLELDRVVPVEKRRVGARMKLVVPLARLVLLPDGGLSRGLFSVFVAARDETGRITPVGRRSVPLQVPTGETERDFTYVVELPMRTGLDHDVAVGVRDELGGEASFLRRTVTPRDGG